MGGTKQQSGIATGVSTLAQLLPTAARRFSTRPALIPANGRTLSFNAAERAVHAVARTLLDAGVGKGDRVVIAMHKTTDAFVLVHGLLRIGAVVVPVDPLMPTSSMLRLLSTTSSVAVVLDSPTLQRFDPLDAPQPSLGLFSPDEETPPTHPSTTSLRTVIDDAVAASTSVEPFSIEIEPDDPAYIIFTSGSTGEPKGMVHTHRSALAYAEIAVAVHRIGPDDRLSGLPPLHFDMSTLELYAAPLAGAAVMPVGTAELRFPATFTERSEQHGLTLWYAVPFQLRQVVERGALDQRDLTSLRHIVYAGEAFPHTSLSELMRAFPSARITNAYGPAETNVVTVHDFVEAPTGPVPIGVPWGDVRVRIVDPNRSVSDPGDLIDVADGEQGELWFHSRSTMDGYFERPDLTAERIVGVGTDRWYRTGDLAHLDAGGRLHLDGRIDHQVKVRGTRLELEAVEAALVGHADIVEAVVAPDRNPGPADHLVAAVQLVSGADDIDPKAIRRWSMSHLPQVAVPASIAVWESFPLTSSGKIDRKSVRADLASNDTHHTNDPR